VPADCSADERTPNSSAPTHATEFRMDQPIPAYRRHGRARILGSESAHRRGAELATARAVAEFDLEQMIGGR
jgi:hypothetical protein